MNKKWLLAASALVLVALGSGLAWKLLRSSRTPTVSFSQPMGGDFSLPSTEGRFDLAKERGRVVFLFFGFTHCPHICPTTLANLNAMLKGLSPHLAGQVRVVFVSIDPERDTLEKIRLYTGAFKNKNILRATDTDASLRKIAGLYGASFSRFKANDGSPIVEHTSEVFVINQRGEWVNSLPFNSDPAEFRHAFEVASDMRPVVERLHPLRDLEELGRNEGCEIGTGRCEIRVGDHAFLATVSPTPPRQGQKIKVSVKGAHPEWIPVLLDLVGIERDMGYLRPKLESESGGTIYSAQFEIPICDVQSMHWRARVVLKHREGNMAAITYLLATDSERP